ncbi:DUF938 domain-containing protein [Vibrio sp. WJH972]
MTKRFSDSCERNQNPILEQIAIHFNRTQHVLEIGSGTGQHAVFFAKHLPHLVWNTSDMLENHASINAWIADSKLPNVTPPFDFHFGKNNWPDLQVDGIFTANTTHIMQRHDAKLMMETIGENLQAGGLFCQYGPMKVDGDFTSDSNREFDIHLQKNGYGGIRDIDELTGWASNLSLTQTISMPANNFLLVWKAA